MAHPRRLTQGTPSRMAQAVRPVIEALENRQMLSVSLGEDGTLSLIGTEGADVISVRPASRPGRLLARVNDELKVFPAASVKAITMQGLAGDDVMGVWEMGRRIKAPAFIEGGAGNDRLGGASGADSLVGGDGDDLLNAGAGDDLLNGGQGNDRLLGGRGNNVLIGGGGDDQLIDPGARGKAIGGAGRDQVSRSPRLAFPTSTYTGDPTGYSPKQIRAAYGLGDLENKSYTNRGKGQAIAIVIPFHSPRARQDLIAFSKQYKLPLPNKNTFRQIYANGRKPLFDQDATTEAMLDIQWAHAIAPQATIYLIEAESFAQGDLYVAVDKAITLLNKKHRGGVVSMSWGLVQENPTEAMFESTFSDPRAKNITFVAAAGDFGGVPSYPASSAYVTAVGGTVLYADAWGNRVPDAGFAYYGAYGQGNTPNPNPGGGQQAGSPGGEEAWNNGGGGPSAYIEVPIYQENHGIGPMRATPDLSMIAQDVPIFNSSGGTGSSGYWGEAGWFNVAGTSASAPMFAGIVALANQIRRAKRLPLLGNTLNERIYRLGGTGADRYFNDIDNGGTGAAAVNPGGGGQGANYLYPATLGWDYATGWGSPNARTLIPALAQQSMGYVNKTIKLTGTRSALTYANNQQGGGTGTASGQVWGGFKGMATIRGMSTLMIDPIHFTQTFGSAGALAVDFYGVDSQNGNATASTFDPNTGRLLTRGTPILLQRIGNTLSGTAYYTAVDGTGTGNQGGNQGGGGGTQTTNIGQTGGSNSGGVQTGAVKFVGTISSKGKIKGSFYSVDLNGDKINGIFNADGLAVIRGNFST